MSEPCPYFNQGLFIGSSPAQENLISMCCWQKKIVTQSVHFDHPYLESTRQSQLELPAQCSKYCSIPGHVANERERGLREVCWDSTGKKIKKLHLEQSLACNLTCISCSSLYSSAWNNWYREFDSTAPLIRLKKSPDSVWKDLDLSNLESLHFTGGEPLINPDNTKILQHLDALGNLSNVSIAYNTNGTIQADDHLLELWSRAKWVRLNFSLDGIESTFEYTRYPAKWKTVLDNINWYRSVKGPCILVEVNAIVGIHNIFNMLEFYKWWKNECQTGNQGDPSQIFCRSIGPSSYGGKVLNIKHLPVNLKEEAQDILCQISQVDGASGLINDVSTDSNNDWIGYFEKLDLLRNTNWKKSLPHQLSKYNLLC